jgi:hypothetical protein
MRFVELAVNGKFFVKRRMEPNIVSQLGLLILKRHLQQGQL